MRERSVRAYRFLGLSVAQREAKEKRSPWRHGTRPRSACLHAGRRHL